MGRFYSFGQVRKRSIVSAPNIPLGDGVSAHPYAFSNTKNVEFHAVKHNENEAHLIAGGARSPHYLQGLAAGKSCFVDEVLPLFQLSNLRLLEPPEKFFEQ
jgi:hypothetical protein